MLSKQRALSVFLCCVAIACCHASGSWHHDQAGSSSQYPEDIDLELNLGIGNVYSSSPEASEETSASMINFDNRPWMNTYQPRPTGRTAFSSQAASEIPWEVTRPGYDICGKADAAWTRDPATQKWQKDKVARYLLVKWRYLDDETGMAKTRKRMRERIGHREAEVLLDHENQAAEAEAIAHATMPSNKNPDNAVVSAKGAVINEALILHHGMRPARAAEEIRQAYQLDDIWTKSPQDIIDYIVIKCRLERN